MKVMFVGINNKKGVPPLSSSTKTGKIVDMIGEGLNVVKTNLCPFEIVGKYPSEEEIKNGLKMLENLISKEKPDEIVCLGAIVSKYVKGLSIKHPSYISRQGKEATKRYIKAVRAVLSWRII